MTVDRILAVARANPYGSAVFTVSLMAAVAIAVTRPDNWVLMLVLAVFLVLSGALRLRETARRLGEPGAKPGRPGRERDD